MNMNYTITDIAEKLKIAREAKGLTQRQLSQLAGVPQSHISKIESGAVDLRLSSLIELSRVLELELTLVPRKAISAVNSIVHSSERATRNIGSGMFTTQKELNRIQNTIAGLTKKFPANNELAEVQRQTRDLQRFQVPDSYLKTIQDAGRTLREIEKNSTALGTIGKTLSEFQNLRNSLAHASFELPKMDMVRPAYSLDVENDG